MAIEKKTSDNESQKEAIKRFLKALLRWVLIVLIVVVLAVGIYAGAMIAYGNIVNPLRDNTARLSVEETRQAKVQAELEPLQTQVNELQTQHQADATALAVLKSDQKDAQKTLEEQVNLLSFTVEEMQKTLDASEAPMAGLRREVQLVKAMELLSRSRMYLVQSNFGLARQDVVTARQILVDLKGEVPGFQVETINIWLLRLDLALDNLPGSPVTAADDLEILWRLMVAGLPASPITVTPSITPSITPSDTLTPFPTITETPASEPTLMLTITASVTPTANNATVTVTPELKVSPTPTPR